MNLIKLHIISATFLLVSSFQYALAQQWELMDDGVQYQPAYSFVYDSTNNQVYVFGWFDLAGSDSIPVNGTAIYKDDGWLAMGNGVTSPNLAVVYTGYVYNADLYVGGSFNVMDGLPNTNDLAKWSNGQWESWASTDGFVIHITEIDDELHVLGKFDTIANQAIHNWAIWDGTTWYAGDTTELFDYLPNAIIKYQDDIYIGGNFMTSNNINDIAKQGVSGWEALGPGLLGDPWVNDMEVYQGLLYVAGEFSGAAGNAATGIMAWDGTQWLDPFPPIEMLSQVRSVEVIGGRLVWNGLVRVDGQVEQYGLCWYDGQTLCITGGENTHTWYIGGAVDTVYAAMCQTINCEPYGDTVNFVAKWDLTNANDTCFNMATGIDEARSRYKLQAYPNPFSNTTLVQIPQDMSVKSLTLFDHRGRICWSKELLNSQEIYLGRENLPSGIYILELITNSREKAFLRLGIVD